MTATAPARCGSSSKSNGAITTQVFATGGTPTSCSSAHPEELTRIADLVTAKARNLNSKWARPPRADGAATAGSSLSIENGFSPPALPVY